MRWLLPLVLLLAWAAPSAGQATKDAEQDRNQAVATVIQDLDRCLTQQLEGAGKAPEAAKEARVVNCLEQYCAPLGELSARKVFGILTVVRIRHFGPDEQNVMHGKDFMQATGDVCQPLLAKMRKLNFDYKEQVAQDLCNCMQQAQQPALESEEEPAPKRVLADYRRCARQHWLVARYLASYDYALEKIEGSMAAEACPQVMKLLKRAREATTEAAQE